MARIVAVFALHRQGCRHARDLSHDFDCACNPHRVMVDASFRPRDAAPLEERVAMAMRAVQRLTTQALEDLRAEAES